MLFVCFQVRGLTRESRGIQGASRRPVYSQNPDLVCFKFEAPYHLCCEFAVGAAAFFGEEVVHRRVRRMSVPIRADCAAWISYFTIWAAGLCVWKSLLVLHMA